MRRHPRLEAIDRIAGYPNPFETILLLASVAQGVLVAFGVRSPIVEAALGDGWLIWLWAVLQGVGGLAALLGLYWPGDPFSAVELKRVGLVMAGFGALIYAAALALTGRPTAYAVAAWGLAFTLACFVRAWQVTRLLVHAEQAVSAAREATDG